MSAPVDTAFVSGTTITSDWLNGVNDTVINLNNTKKVSVKDAQFSVVGDGTTDDTLAIQAAINSLSATGGSVYFPPGTYKISSELTLSDDGVVLIGSSRNASRILQVTSNAKILNISGLYCGYKSLSFSYSSTPTVGATAIYVSSGYVTLQDFIVHNAYICIEFFGSNAVAGKITDFELFNYESIGLKASFLNDLFVSRFIINAGNAARGANGGIRLDEKVEAFICTDGDILMGQYSMVMDAAAYGIGTRPAYNNFTNVFFDSAVNPTQINDCVETEFVGCWFSGGRSGAGSAGVSVTNSQSLRFTNCRFFNCGAQGIVVNSTATDIAFVNCKAESNSVTAGSGVSHGFQFADNTTQFQVIGCMASNGLYTGTQGYGIFVGSGCDQFVIRDCNVVGNTTGSISDGSSATADKTVAGNIGYRTSNTGTGTVLSGTTSIAVDHGLNVTPRVQDILLTRQGTNAGSTDLYVTGVTSTQFTINTDVAPASNIAITWHARCKGA